MGNFNLSCLYGVSSVFVFVRGSAVMAGGLSSAQAAWGLNCPTAYRVFIPQPGTEPSCIGIMWILFFFNLYLFIFLVVLGLHCCVQVFSSCSEQAIIIGVHEPLYLVTSLLHSTGSMAVSSVAPTAGGIFRTRGGTVSSALVLSNP